MSERREDLSREERHGAGDVELEQLLRHAPPRQTPDDVAAAATRAAVYGEWQKVVGQRQRRGRTRWAIAATMLITVFAVVGLYRPASVDIVQVASIQKSFGAVSIFGAQRPHAELNSLATIYGGQTIVTGPQAGMAIAWENGGSIRVDRNTKLEILSNAAIYLHTGRVYFDSSPAHLTAANTTGDAAQFIIETARGRVAHVGTQFMATVDSDVLIVAVREGRVDVQGSNFEAAVELREKVILSGSRVPVVSTDSGHGKEWSWVARTTPPFSADGKSIDRFLGWAGRELGLQVNYETPGAKQVAMTDEMRGVGRIDVEPRKALALYIDATELQTDIVGGVINVRLNE